jgi:hypothetical protein
MSEMDLGLSNRGEGVHHDNQVFEGLGSVLRCNHGRHLLVAPQEELDELDNLLRCFKMIQKERMYH